MVQNFRTKHMLIFLITLYFSCVLSKDVKIGFLVNYLSVTGVEVALYDYADCNETILGNSSYIIALPIHDPALAPQPELVREKFRNRFKERYHECSSLQKMDQLLAAHHVDILYMLRGAGLEHVLSRVCKNAVHVAFLSVPMHGDIYACASRWLSQQYQPYADLPYVPHMIRPPQISDNLREHLAIPDHATVFGRYGGRYGFDIPFVKEAIVEVAKKSRNTYFLFMNTDAFCNLPNVIFLPATADLNYKEKFVNTCDAMIHARIRGETFGLACGEFSIKNKPVITWICSPERSHIDILGDKAIYYLEKKDLIKIFTEYKKDTKRNYDAYSADYNPKTVMKKFEEVFIQPLLQKKNNPI